MKLVFICGPFRASTRWGMLKLIRNAERAALSVAERGAFPVCPHKNTENFHGLLTDEFWLKGYKSLLARCDGILILNGWEASSGSREEVELAEKLGLEAFRDCPEQLGWLKRWAHE